MSGKPHTLAYFRELLDYDPDTGIFRWAKRRCGIRVGSVAGSLNQSGHRQIKIDGRMIQAHRLAWLFIYGEWPPEFLDHLNGAPDDNRMANLRVASRELNRENQRKAQRNNRVGLLGVSRYFNRFHAQIGVKGKKFHLGYFATAEEAHACYLTAKRRLHEGCTI